jgi:hypothetical protein
MVVDFYPRTPTKWNRMTSIKMNQTHVLKSYDHRENLEVNKVDQKNLLEEFTSLQ